MLLKKEITEYNRYQAFAVHMAISLALFLILLVCITQYWYPGILFDTGNGWRAIGIIIGIDLVLGPLLTLIVFNPKKSSLKFDLFVIALVQTAALIYGSWTIHQTRPVALAFINTSFMTIFATSDMADKVIERTHHLKTNELYYQFDETKQEGSLNPTKFAAYEEFSDIVNEMITPYRTNDLIQLNPLLSSNQFIQINEADGSIIGFFKK